MKVANNAGFWVRAALLGLVGTGVAGNGIWTYTNQQEQAQHTAVLNDELGKSKEEINSLRAMSGDLNRSKLELLRLLQGEKSVNELQAAKMLELSKELGSIITPEHVMRAIEMVTPSTVMIQGEVEMMNPFTGETQKGTVTGSGFIMIGERGERYIVTNGHVIQDSEIRRNPQKDAVYHVKMYNGSDFKKPIEFDASPVILGNGKRAYSSPEEHDMAILAIPPDVVLPPTLGLKLRDISKNPLRVGEPVFSIGNPFRQRDTVTFGIISHVDRETTGLNINHNVQIDAPINPGNSGGPSLTIRIVDGKIVPEVIMINTYGFRGGDGIAGGARADEIAKTAKSWGIMFR